MGFTIAARRGVIRLTGSTWPQRIMGMQMRGAMAPIQQLAPQSSTAITMNMGGNTFNTGTSEAAFDARVEQAMRRQLRR